VAAFNNLKSKAAAIMLASDKKATQYLWDSERSSTIGGVSKNMQKTKKYFFILSLIQIRRITSFSNSNLSHFFNYLS
jgi:hypothetical protein